MQFTLNHAPQDLRSFRQSPLQQNQTEPLSPNPRRRALLTLEAAGVPRSEWPTDVPPHVDYEAYTGGMAMVQGASMRKDRNTAQDVAAVKRHAIDVLRLLGGRLWGEVRRLLGGSSSRISRVSARF